MKVCHMSSAHKSTDIRIFKKQCISLVDAGYEVFLVATGSSRVEDGVQVIGVGDQHKRVSRMLIDTYKVYKSALLIDADIYQIHDPELLPYALRLKRKGKKVIFDSHEDVVSSIKEKEYIPSFLRKVTCFLYKLYQNRVLKKMDAILSVTPHLVEELKKVNENTVMITNYPIISNKNKLDEDKLFDLCFGGGISKQWMHHNILKAMENIENCNYVLCGNISSDYLAELKKFESWQQVDYMGTVSHSEMENIYKKSKIGVALLDYVLNAGGKLGTLGNTKLFEFMQAGLPVICTDFILWKEIIEKYKCGICVNPNSIKEVVNAVLYIESHPDEAIVMGENGRKAVEEEYNWNKEEDKLLKLYQSL